MGIRALAEFDVIADRYARQGRADDLTSLNVARCMMWGDLTRLRAVYGDKSVSVEDAVAAVRELVPGGSTVSPVRYCEI